MFHCTSLVIAHTGLWSQQNVQSGSERIPLNDYGLRGQLPARLTAVLGETGMDQEQIDSLLSYIEQVRKRTLWVALCIPLERLERALAPMRFTFGDILRHVAATERYVFVENAARRRSRYPGHDTALAKGYGGVMGYMAELHQESVSILRSLEPDDFERYCSTPGGAPVVIWQWLRDMVEHENHHRGEICGYLATLGIRTPLLFGLTSELDGAARLSPKSGRVCRDGGEIQGGRM